MSTKLLVCTEITAQPGKCHELALAWDALPGGSPSHADPRRRAVYKSLDGRFVLELVWREGWNDIAQSHAEWALAWRDLAFGAASDFRRQVLAHIESPKPSSTPVPCTPFLQLRHVEVLPARHEEYRRWRQETIFRVVKAAPEIEAFLAFHTIVSTEPGVMFLSGFSCGTDEYDAVFSSQQYRQIVREAGASYLTGGAGGLSTRTYRRVSAPAAS